MGDTENRLKFEFLPNEILIECFEYLNSWEIYDSFDQLNLRFSTLIRTISLQLNFQYVRKSTFDQFCQQILSNPQIQDQIHTLQLSNQETYNQIEIFFSIFPLNQFSNLRSLIFIQVTNENLEELKLMLPFISKLSSIHLIDSPHNTLSILKSVYDPSLIQNLTLTKSSLNELCELFQYTPMLKYLNVQDTNEQNKEAKSISDNYVFHLKQLIIGKCNDQFEDFERFIKYMPNLTDLIICSGPHSNMIDADQWEQLITSSLPYLKKFKFIFTSDIETDNEIIIINKFKRFQSDFWQKQHHWYTEYILDKCSAIIYTIPYLSDKYELKSDTIPYSNQLVNSSHTFHHVTGLILSYKLITKNCSYYFSNVKSLIIKGNFNDIDSSIGKEHVDSLRRIINLSNLRHFGTASPYKVETGLVLLELLKHTPHLSSLTIDPNQLISFFDNNALCQHLNKMIKKLNLYDYCRFLPINADELMNFCKIFSNLQQLICFIKKIDDLLILFDQLPKLSNIQVYAIAMVNLNKFFSRFRDIATQKNINFQTDHKRLGHNVYQVNISIWCG